MNPRIKKVYPLQDYELHLVFMNGEEFFFDLKPYLDTGVFKALKHPALFKTVRPFLGSIAWANNIDLGPDTLYLESKKKRGLMRASVVKKRNDSGNRNLLL